jgi:pantoate--beta-alanine ligase
LALSSRNSYLTAAERARAPQLYASLRAMAEQLAAGEKWVLVQGRIERELSEAGFVLDYLALRDAQTLQEPHAATTSAVILVAAWLGQTRLIDNLLLSWA